MTQLATFGHACMFSLQFTYVDPAEAAAAV